MGGAIGPRKPRGGIVVLSAAEAVSLVLFFAFLLLVFFCLLKVFCLLFLGSFRVEFIFSIGVFRGAFGPRQPRGGHVVLSGAKSVSFYNS